MNMAGHHFHEANHCGRTSAHPSPIDGEIYSALIPDCVFDPDKQRQQNGTDRRISVKLVSSTSLRASACDLINRRYGWRGYGANHRLHERPATTSFIASIDEEVVGTITLTVDSSAGLAADHIFRDEIDTARSEAGAQVCELTKFAFDTDIPSKPLLAALFHIVFIYGQRRYRCTDLFIEVNPRHRRFYQTLLGFKPVGELKMNESVAAPSQLMVLKVEDISAMISAHRHSPLGPQTRSLYPHFLSRDEEEAVRRRLAARSADMGPSWFEGIVTEDSRMPIG